MKKNGLQFTMRIWEQFFFLFFFHMQEQGYNGQGKNWLMYIPLSEFFLCRCKLV